MLKNFLVLLFIAFTINVYSLSIRKCPEYAIIREFLDPLHKSGKPDTPFTRDLKNHALCVAPVFTKKTPIFVSFTDGKGVMTYENGNIYFLGIFKSREVNWPVISIRPVDDDQEIKFIATYFFKGLRRSKKIERVELFFPFPEIFDPEVMIDRLFLSGGKVTRIAVRRFHGYGKVVIIEFKRSSDAGIGISLAGRILLNKYEKIPQNKFKKSMCRIPKDLKVLACPVSGREFKSDFEKEELSQIAKKISAISKDVYTTLLNTLLVVSKNLEYFKNNQFFTPFQILINKKGDCNDFSRIMATFLRFNHIPVEMVFGLVFDYKILERHAWLHVALPTKKNRLHWFIVDPTFASTSFTDRERIKYVQYKNPYYLYPVQLRVASSSTLKFDSYNLFFNFKNFKGVKNKVFIDSVIGEVRNKLWRYIEEKKSKIDELKLKIYKDFPAMKFGDISLINSDVSKDAKVTLKLDIFGDAHLSIKFGKEIDYNGEEIKRIRNFYHTVFKRYFGKVKKSACLKFEPDFDADSMKIKGVNIYFSRLIFEIEYLNIINFLHKYLELEDREYIGLKRLYEILNGKNFYQILNFYLNERRNEKKIKFD